MKKILFFIFAALAFVACDKEKEDNRVFVRCELNPQAITLPAGGGTFTIKANTPAYIASCGFEASENIYKDLGFGTGTLSIPTSFPHIYEPKQPQLPSTPDFAAFEGTYHIEQIDATTFNITVMPPDGYDGVSLLFIPEGGLKYGQSLNIKIE